MLESESTHTLVARLLQHSSLVVHANYVLQVKNVVCETLMPDAVVLEAYQTDHSYACELNGPTFDSLV